MTKPYHDSASRTCPNGHEYTIEWADEDICPDCGAEPGDAVTPEDATPEVLDEWIADNGQPGCPACETGDAVEWVPVEDRPVPVARWRCECCGRYIDAGGAEIKRGMTDRPATVADVCRIVATRTGDQQTAHVLRDAANELDRMTAELAKHQPEEREGRCGCGWSVWMTDRDDTDLIGWHCGKFVTNSRHCGLYCDQCGDLLDRDGIARRNADTARVQRVREALDVHDELKYLSDGTSHEICRAIDAIRAALNGGVHDE